MSITLLAPKFAPTVVVLGYPLIVKWSNEPGLTVIEEVVADLVPSVAVIVCDGVVLSVKAVPANVCAPLSLPSPVVNVYLLPEVKGRIAAPSVEVKKT